LKRLNLENAPGWVGVDEVGRGCLAGPVVVAAVRIPMDFDLTGVHDSKLLNRSQRELQSARILSNCECLIEQVSELEIDKYNILHATLHGMARSANRFSDVNLVLIDGNQMPLGLLHPARTAVKGDGTYACIAAASIIAKVSRDNFMARQAVEFPGYGFDIHHGYPTPEHLEALNRMGPTSIHRRSFAPVANLLNQPCLDLM